MSYHLVFLDCETTGLDAGVHRPWEVAWRVFTVEGATLRQTDADCVQVWLDDDEIKCAEPIALEIGRFDERYDAERALSPVEAAPILFVHVPEGARLCGSNPGFDDRMVGGLLDRAGYQRPWHYHHMDVPTLVAGYAAGTLGAHPDDVQRFRASAMKSDELSRLIGIEPDDYARHTAMGDVDWTVAMYAYVHGLTVVTA